jgi:glucosamine--fructose-6-phosphate aminotransferase (isomerizing)
MCGIVGYLGSGKASDIILSGLEKLEYRGYDSCGICFFSDPKKDFVTYKDKGRVAHLIDDFDYRDANHLAIGHTRWATHGKPNQINSHPHFSATKRFALVHNGVIENYRELTKKYLEGVVFHSETDTEVIANLIDSFAETMPVDEAIRKTLSLIEGSYALLILDTDSEGTIYAAKNKSPLLIGTAESGVTLASDVMAMVGHADQYFPIEDKTFVVVRRRENVNELQVMDIIGRSVDYKMMKIDMVVEEIGKAGYPHYMLKEICEQPSVIRKILSKYFDAGELTVKLSVRKLLGEANRIYILAAGTSMHAGFVGKYLFEHIAKIPTEVHIASEFAYNPPLLADKPLFVFVSQSGETADLRACLINVKELGHPTLTITNVPTSTLAREADQFVEIFAGPEIAVASTKAYIAQVAVLSVLAFSVSRKPPFDLHGELTRVAIAMDAIIEERDYIQKLVQKYFTKRNCFYIGRGIDYYACLEAALKLKEISYIQTEGFAAGELKHGTIALIEDDIPVIAIVSQSHLNNNTRANIREVTARGAAKLVISLQSISDPTDEIVLMDVHEMLSPLLTVIPTQLIAYYSALALGRDIDKPRNLAKSVTVE